MRAAPFAAVRPVASRRSQAAAAHPTISTRHHQLAPVVDVASVSAGRRNSVLSAPRPSVSCQAATPGGGAGESGEMSELQRTQANDQLIDLLLAAKSREELGKTVADNILSFDQKFWLRLAARNDTASDEETKRQLTSLATVIMTLVQELVKASEGQMEESSQVLQDILVAAADERGEWVVPLSKSSMDAMNKAMDENVDKVDEAVLSNAFAWMRKASDDKLDGMVVLLQKVLQLYAAKQLKSEGTLAEDQVLNKLLDAREEEWNAVLNEAVANGECSEVSFMEALQRRMEGTVLNLKSGSYAQRVQAEFLKELEDRAQAVFKANA